MISNARDQDTRRFIDSNNGNPSTSTPRSDLDSFPHRLISIIFPPHLLDIQYHSNVSRQFSQRVDVPLNHISSPVTPCMPIIPQPPHRIQQPIPPPSNSNIHQHNSLHNPQQQVIELST